MDRCELYTVKLIEHDREMKIELLVGWWTLVAIVDMGCSLRTFFSIVK